MQVKLQISFSRISLQMTVRPPTASSRERKSEELGRKRKTRRGNREGVAELEMENDA